MLVEHENYDITPNLSVKIVKNKVVFLPFEHIK